MATLCPQDDAHGSPEVRTENEYSTQALCELWMVTVLYAHALIFDVAVDQHVPAASQRL